MDKTISEFISEHQIASLCVADTKPYCFIVFYTFMPEYNLLLFKSQLSTRHAQILQNKPFISGTILPDNNSLLKVKGLQFCGELTPHPALHALSANAKYYLTYPMGIAIPGQIWQVEIREAKLTDNGVHFGYKLNWKKED
ncbi:MAG TPA: hypothetical protein PLQ93_13595 [Bacteroidia bacterium]|nr:hypothetical protein [Bacteroidia bacterium]